jgi:multiple sugar transport system permease protein
MSTLQVFSPEFSKGEFRVNVILKRLDRLEESSFGLLMVSPVALIILIVVVVPIGYALVMSTQNIQLTQSAARPFVGLGNYLRLLDDSSLRASIPRTLYLAGMAVFWTTLIALLVALLLNEVFPGRGIVRVLLLVPWAIADIANGVMWKFIFSANIGILNTILHQLGLIREFIPWLADAFTALNIVVLGETWKGMPLVALLILAALQGIPDVQYKSAKMDGANLLQRFRYVTLPYLRNTLFVIAVLQIVWMLQVFGLIYALTNGGPLQGTVVVNFLIYLRAFQTLNIGYAAALAVLLSLTIMAISSVLVYGQVRMGAGREQREGIADKGELP